MRKADAFLSGSLLYGTVESEDLYWERRSSFSHTSSLEKVDRCSKTDSVTEKKTILEAQFGKKRVFGLCSPRSRSVTDSSAKRCFEYEFSHAHSSKYASNTHEIREQEEDKFDSSSLDAQIEYSFDNAKDFDCSSEHEMVEEHCDNPGSTFVLDSRLETEVDEVGDHGAANLDAAGVLTSSTALLCDTHGVEEDRDASPEGHRVSSFEDIYLPCSSGETCIISTTPPLQLVLDQQPQPSHCRSAAPPPATAAPPPPLHVEQQHSDPSRHQHTSHSNGQPWQTDRQLLPRSPSCCHPMTHLRQAEPYFEPPTAVQQPLCQRPSSFQHPPSLCSATKLVSCEEKHLGVEADSDVLNQVDLQLSGVELVDDDVHVVQVSENDEDDGLHDSRTIASCEFDGGLALIYMKRVGADALSLLYPSINSEKLQNLFIVELQDARRETVYGLSDMLFLDAMKRTFHLRDVYIEYMVVGYWGTINLLFAFDPGGDISTTLWQATLRCVADPTLTTRWILTVGELIRSYILLFSYIF